MQISKPLFRPFYTGKRTFLFVFDTFLTQMYKNSVKKGKREKGTRNREKGEGRRGEGETVGLGDFVTAGLMEGD